MKYFNVTVGHPYEGVEIGQQFSLWPEARRAEIDEAISIILAENPGMGIAKDRSSCVWRSDWAHPLWELNRMIALDYVQPV